MLQLCCGWTLVRSLAKFEPVNLLGDRRTRVYRLLSAENSWDRSGEFLLLLQLQGITIIMEVFHWDLYRSRLIHSLLLQPISVQNTLSTVPLFTPFFEWGYLTRIFSDRTEMRSVSNKDVVFVVTRLAELHCCGWSRFIFATKLSF
jgi:hypothetical protein